MDICPSLTPSAAEPSKAMDQDRVQVSSYPYQIAVVPV